MEITKPKFRILTFHHITNNGAFLFAYALMRLFQKEFPSVDVRVLDYKSPRLMVYEFLKRFRFFQHIPLFYLKRARMWKRFIQEHLDLDEKFPHLSSKSSLQRYFDAHYSALIIGMDVWCLSRGTQRPPFPNLYWLPAKIGIPKIAYGVSGYESDPALLHQNAARIRDYLDDFSVIGCRDRFTHQMVLSHRRRKDGLIEKIPDPTLFYQFPSIDISEKLRSLGVAMDKPLLGVLLFGQEKLSQAIHSHFQEKGYQVLALSMHNPWADVNLGHLLNPFEWAEVFRYLNFCFTDRFHGTVFCIKNRVPFLSLEKEQYLPRSQSKLFDLLTDFELQMCYTNPGEKSFNADEFLRQANDVEKSWEKIIRPFIEKNSVVQQNKQEEFILAMKSVISTSPR